MAASWPLSMLLAAATLHLLVLGEEVEVQAVELPIGELQDAPLSGSSLLQMQEVHLAPRIGVWAGPNRTASAPSTDDTPPGPKAVQLGRIFTLCIVMYGSIGVMWALNWSKLKAGGANGEEAQAQFLQVGLLCVTWASTSVGMHVLNKTLVESLEAPAMISAIQMVIAVVVVGTCAGDQMFRAPLRQLHHWMVVPMLFAAMLCTSFYAYERISLSLLTVVRNLTPLVVLPIESLVMPAEKRPVVTAPVVGYILVMLLGAMIYGGSILPTLSLVGVAFALLNMFLAVTDRLVQRRLLTEECKDLPAAVCTIVNNTVGIVPTLFLAMATSQVQEMATPGHKVHWLDPRVQVLLVLSGLVGIGICYLGFECQRAISATSFFVLQNVSKVVVVSAGIVFFADPIKSPSAVLGLALSLGGSFMYGKSQMALSAPAARAAPEARGVPPEATAADAIIAPGGKREGKQDV